MKRIFRLVTVATMTVVMTLGFATFAGADTIILCNSVPCFGTNGPDDIYERDGDDLSDQIRALRGADFVDASDFDSDRDLVNAGRGKDRVRTNDGDGRDIVRCGKGNDVAVIDEGDTTRGCERVRER